MKRKVIGIDLDATLAQYSDWHPVVGAPYPGAKEFLAGLKTDGWTICIWTGRADVQVRDWLQKHSMSSLVDFINESPYPTDSIKQSFDLYVGDEALRFTSPDNFEVLAEEIKKIGRVRHWGTDSFERDVVFSDRNPIPYYQGTGKLYLDIFDGLTEKLWEAKGSYKPIAILTICSHAKPYAKSWIHCEIRRALHSAVIMTGQIHTKMLDQIDYIHISNAGIIPHESSKTESIINRYDWNGADITKEEVKDLLRERIRDRLQKWYSVWGNQYKGIIVYLRPSGNTIRAVRESGIPCTFPSVREYPSPAWTEFPDVDDCLADPRNTQVLQLHVRNELFSRWLKK